MSTSSSQPHHLLLLPLSLLLLLNHLAPPFATAQPLPSFTCTTPKAACKALVGYISPNTTTLSHIQSLFQVKTLRSLLGVNNLPPITLPNYTVLANSTVKIPINCVCINGSGISYHAPNYAVVKDDGLFHIANQVFSGLVDYHQIVQVNEIKDANLIYVGQKLWIPLPCSCDNVDGEEVVHYAHVVGSGSSVGQIAAEFGTTSDSLMRLNNMSDPTALVAGQVLDVPLRACSSSVNSSSLDSPLLVANGTYVYTANNCVRCQCDATNNYLLQCQPSGLNAVNWDTCPAMSCLGSNLSLGNSSIPSGCTRTACAYAGYNSRAVLTTLAVENTCPAPGPSANTNRAPAIHQRGWSLAVVMLYLHLTMLQRLL